MKKFLPCITAIAFAILFLFSFAPQKLFAQADPHLDTTKAAWNMQYPPLDILAPDRLYAANDHVIYILSGGKVARSADSGITWSQYSLPGCFEAAGAAFYGDSLIWLVGDRGSMYKSTNGGVSWVYHEIDLSAVDLRFISFATPLVGWLGGTYGFIMKTTDGGDSWAFQNYWDDFDVDGVSSVKAISDSIAWLSHFHIINNNQCGFNVDIVRTTDGGQSWGKMYYHWFATNWISTTTPYLLTGNACASDRNIDLSNIIGCSATDAALYLLPNHLAAEDSSSKLDTLWSVYNTNDAGKHWSSHDLDSNAVVRFPKMLDCTRGWGTDVVNAYLYRSVNPDSMQWVRRTTPHNLPVMPNLFDFIDTLRGWCFVANGDGTISIYQTTDGALTWKPRVTMPTSLGSLKDVAFMNRDTGWAVGSTPAGGIVMQTTDRGKDWNILNSTVNDSLLSVHFVDPEHGWVLGDSIHVTSDGGHTWRVDERFPFDSTRSWVKYVVVEFADDSTGWIMRNDWQTYRTTNRGATWNQVHDRDTTVNITVARAASANSITAIGALSGAATMFRIVNAGAAFQEFPLITSVPAGTNPPMLPSALCFSDSLHGWLMDTTPSLFKSTDGGASWNFVSSSVDFQPPGEMSFKPNSPVYSYRLGHMMFTDSVTGWVLRQANFTWSAFSGGGQFPEWVFLTPAEVVKVTDGGMTTQIAPCISHAQHGIAFVGDSLGWTVGDNLSVYNYFLPYTARPHFAPRMVVAPPAINFGSVVPADVKTDSVNIYNIGNDTLNIFGASVTEKLSHTFNVATLLPLQIPPGDTVVMKINFDPRVASVYADTLYVYSNDDTQRILLIGTGAFFNDVSDAGIAALRSAQLNNYPNPFTGTTTIHFNVNNASQLPPNQMLVYDAYGRTIADLTAQARRSAAVHFDATDLPAGMYYCVARYADHAVSQRMMVVK